jgi:hypothetical protein
MSTDEDESSTVRSGWIQKYPYLIEWPLAVFDVVLGLLGVAFGVIAPILIHLAPIEKQGELVIHGVWFAIFFVASAIIRNMVMIPILVGRHTGALRTAVANRFVRMGNEIGQAFYLGFYTLTASEGLRVKFKALDDTLADPTIHGRIRDIIFGFLAQSVANTAESGLAMIDVEVDEYVKLLERLLLIQDQIVKATCVVRPYWFVSPQIEKVSLAPSEKAGHLISFRDYHSPSTPPSRLAVYDEWAIADMLLTGLLDRELHRLGRDGCPNCNSIKQAGGPEACPFHRDKRAPYDGDQIPEIRWFEEDVNKSGKKHVNLMYTRVQHPGRNVLSALEDRVFFEPKVRSPPIDVRFSFITLSRGILWLRWGQNAQKFEDFQGTGERLTLVCARNQNHVPTETHKVYKKFWIGSLERDCLLGAPGFANPQLGAMRDYLTAILKPHVEYNFQRGREAGSFQASMLTDGMQKIVMNMIDRLVNETKNGRTLRQIYGDLVTHYQQSGEPSIAYVVSYDASRPEIPVVAVKWKEHWEDICKGS